VKEVALFITGPPAAGKTTLRNSLERVLGFSRPPIGIDQVIRALIASGEFTEQDAYIDEKGAAILVDPHASSLVASNRLIELWREHPFETIIEAPLIDTMFEKLCDYSELAAHTVVIELHARFEVRVARNRDRDEERIGELGMRLMPDTLRPDVDARLTESVAARYRINGELSKHETLRSVLGLLENHGILVPAGVSDSPTLEATDAVD
jgi:dephospho-CoA kinase